MRLHSSRHLPRNLKRLSALIVLCTSGVLAGTTGVLAGTTGLPFGVSAACGCGGPPEIIYQPVKGFIEKGGVYELPEKGTGEIKLKNIGGTPTTVESQLIEVRGVMNETAFKTEEAAISACKFAVELKAYEGNSCNVGLKAVGSTGETSGYTVFYGGGKKNMVQSLKIE